MIVATAPGRCGIVGNPTDMYGGSVISITTRERARCEIEAGAELTLVSRDGGESAVIRTPRDLSLRGDHLDIARAVLTWLKVDPAAARFTLTTSTDIPMKAGMAGSTALVVAVLGAVCRAQGLRLHPWALAETARKIEFNLMHVVCGHQDQHMAVFGGLNYLDFRGKEMLEQRDDEPLATVEPLDTYLPLRPVPLLAAHTGIQHHSGTVHKSPRERWLAGEPAVVEGYRRIAELARRGKRAWLDRDWPTLGALMDENHAIVAGLGGSGPANDRLIEAARAAGAYGAKLAGAGGGGTILALTDQPEGVGQALREAGAESLLTPEPSPGLQVEGNP